MADDKTEDPAEARARAFFEDTVGALEEAHVEGWDAARINAELTDVQRAHGYWTDTPVLGGSLGVDVGVASAGVTADANGGVGVEGTISLPATRNLGRDLDAAKIDGKSPMSVEVGRELFGQAAINTDNNLRGGVQFTFSAEVDATSRSGRTVRGGIEGFVNQSMDGSVQMGVSGSAVPGLLRGRVPIEVGVGVTSDMIDTDMLVKNRMVLFESTIEEANKQDFKGQDWARDTIYNVLDENGGGGAVPESQLVFAAGVAEFEAKHGEADRTETLTIIVGEDMGSRMGLDSFRYDITQAGESEGFYRVTGKPIFSTTDTVHGVHQQKFDAVIDSSGQVIDGYELEYRGGGQQNYATAANGAFGAKSPWNGQLDHRMDSQDFGPSGLRDVDRQHARNKYIRDKTKELDALEDTDLEAVYPDSAAKHAEARWTQDRAERAIENAHDAERLDDYISEIRSGQDSPAPQSPLSDGLQQTPLPNLDLERDFTPLPPMSQERADPTSYAAPSSQEVLSGSDFNWVRPGHLLELAAEDGSVPGVNWPSGGADADISPLSRLRGIFTPNPPGMSLRELSKELHETGRAVNALDTEQQGVLHSSPEGWRMAHPETHARWDALADGIRDGSLEDMRVEVKLTNEAGEILTSHQRADVLSDAVDRASAAQALVTGRSPQALSGPVSDYNRDHPVPGSEESLIASGNEGAGERDANRSAAREMQREAALEDMLQRPTSDSDYSQDQEIDYGIGP